MYPSCSCTSALVACVPTRREDTHLSRCGTSRKSHRESVHTPQKLHPSNCAKTDSQSIMNQRCFVTTGHQRASRTVVYFSYWYNCTRGETDEPEAAFFQLLLQRHCSIVHLLSPLLFSMSLVMDVKQKRGFCESWAARGGPTGSTLGIST